MHYRQAVFEDFWVGFFNVLCWQLVYDLVSLCHCAGQTPLWRSHTDLSLIVRVQVLEPANRLFEHETAAQS